MFNVSNISSALPLNALVNNTELTLNLLLNQLRVRPCALADENLVAILQHRHEGVQPRRVRAGLASMNLDGENVQELVGKHMVTY